VLAPCLREKSLAAYVTAFMKWTTKNAGRCLSRSGVALRLPCALHVPSRARQPLATARQSSLPEKARQTLSLVLCARVRDRKALSLFCRRR